MAKMTVNITIRADGQVLAEVVDGHGKKCITEILGPLELLLGQASQTTLRPEYEWDEEALQLLGSQEVQA